MGQYFSFRLSFVVRGAMKDFHILFRQWRDSPFIVKYFVMKREFEDHEYHGTKVQCFLSGLRDSFVMNLFTRRKGLILGCTYRWSKLELEGATFQDCSTPQYMTSCEGIRSLALKKATEQLKIPFRPCMLYTSVS